MHSYYFDYWKKSNLDALINRGETLDYAFGKSFRDSRIEAGDVVWILSGDGYRALWLVGAIEVRDGVVNQVQAKKLLGRSDITGTESDQYIVNANAGRQLMNKLQIFSLAERLDFLSLAGEPSPRLPMDRIKRGEVGFGNCLQRSRRITVATHVLFSDALLASA